jgi:hypothetical protein
MNGIVKYKKTNGEISEYVYALLKERRAWWAMKDRCNNKKNSWYSHYGDRGIKVCERWMNSFDAFLSDVGEAPTQKHSIERIDNDKGYEPDNCRWATQKEQMNNRRCNAWIEYKGQTKTLTQWCEILGFNYRTIYDRLHRGKHTIERAFTQPLEIQIKRK